MDSRLPKPPDAIRFAARDRILLYIRGMDIDPESGVALALEGMRKAGPDAAPDKTMEALFGLMEQAGPPMIHDADGRSLVCTPPLHRSVVVAREMEPLSFGALLGKVLRRVFSGSGAKHKADHEN